MLRTVHSPDEAIATLSDQGVQRGIPVGIVAHGASVGFAVGDHTITVEEADAYRCVDAVERSLRPRWVMWSGTTAGALVRNDIRVATAWDVAAVHRLLAGGWRNDPARVWAYLHGLDRRHTPVAGQLDLMGGDAGDDGDQPIRPDGYLRAEWVDGIWQRSPAEAAAWASVALMAASLQSKQLQALTTSGAVAGDAEATARAESTAELLCAELAHDGLPIDRLAAVELISSLVGPRPQNDADAAEGRRRRDAAVFAHLSSAAGVDLRNPADVKAMLRRVGIDVPDTRAWRLEGMRSVHPVVDALLAWRKEERIATTFGHTWLAEHVGTDGRLRGAWSASDGAAGRMTAQAGLHNLPAELRDVVVAEHGHVFVRADLGQIEPRVLAAVSGDDALRRATQDDDLYAPVATRLGVERSVAKIAVLAAMYGQTSGTAGQALRGMESGYPVAMKFLDAAAQQGQAGINIRTYGGRLVRVGEVTDGDFRGAAAAARGRYARNAMVQGAAAELFKVWAVTVRARLGDLDARIVLCLHDELLLHVREDHAHEVVALLDRCLGEAAHRWHPTSGVRFVTDTSIVRSWAEAK